MNWQEEMAQRERAAWTPEAVARRRAEAEELRRLMEVGRRAVPGLRIQEQEVAGQLFEMVERGEMARAEFDAWVEELRRANKISEP